MTAEADFELLTDPVRYVCKSCAFQTDNILAISDHVKAHGPDGLQAVLAGALDEWSWQVSREFAQGLMDRMRLTWAEASAEQDSMLPDEKELLASYTKGLQDTANLVKDLLKERRPL